MLIKKNQHYTAVIFQYEKKSLQRHPLVEGIWPCWKQLAQLVLNPSVLQLSHSFTLTLVSNVSIFQEIQHNSGMEGIGYEATLSEGAVSAGSFIHLSLDSCRMF